MYPLTFPNFVLATGESVRSSLAKCTDFIKPNAAALPPASAELRRKDRRVNGFLLLMSFAVFAWGVLLNKEGRVVRPSRYVRETSS
jgi:hypothetical protein